MADIRYPKITGERGVGYWLHPKNLLASRQKIFRVDYSNEWRYEFGDPNPLDRSVILSKILRPNKNTNDGFRIIILGDTGEGDRSQYGLLPLIRELKPDFLIINGDVAYPAGRMGMGSDEDDFLSGFFKPYSNFNCSIWATPGNHEYYSPNNGRDFYDIFCTRKYDSFWSENGLRHINQPGMYWELSDIEQESKLVIIGLDSGKSANLDGHNFWWQLWKRKIYPDYYQHKWLDDRLRIAQNHEGKVIILFHIPALAREVQQEKYLSTIHQIISNYSCVKLVLCGHDHNHQQYSPEVFKRYLEKEEVHRNIAEHCPHYIVSGGGGAYLQSTDYDIGSYQGLRYPSIQQWKDYVRLGRRIVGYLGRDKSWLSRLAGMIDKDSLNDADVAQYLSFILLEYKSDWLDGAQTNIHVTPVFMNDVKELFNHLSDERIVNVTDINPPVNKVSVEKCLQNNLEIRF